MPLRAVIASLLLAASGISAHAGTVAYAEAFDTLYAFDLSTRTAAPIGAAGTYGNTALANIEGLTFSPSGELYAVSDTLLKVLMKIDRATGAATVIGPLGGNAGLGDTGQGAFNVLDLGLSFTCDGSFWQVDPATAAVTKIGNLGATITGLTARQNQLFGAGSNNDAHLYSIDLGSAHATAIGAYGGAIDPITTASPGFDPAGLLWSVLDDVPPLPPQNTQPQWSSLATISTAGDLAIVGDITTPDGMKYPANVTQLPYVGLKGLAIAAPCAVAAPAASDPAPSLSAPASIVLALLLVLGAGTSLRLRRRIA
jgi:hypothetical protein